MNKSFDTVAAIIFAAVSLLHLLRLVFGWQVQVGMNAIPLWVSWGGMFVAAALSVWGFATTRAQKSRPA